MFITNSSFCLNCAVIVPEVIIKKNSTFAEKMNLDNLTKIVQHEINDIAQVNKLKSLCCQLSITAKDYSTIINISPNFIAQKNLGGSYDTIIHEVSEDNSVYHSPIEIFNLIMESKKISPNTKLNYKRTKELLIEFAPLASYQDIDKRFIRAFEIYLTRKNLCANTILKYLKCLKRALRLAQQTGQIKETIEELFSLTMTKAEIIRKESLTPHELNKLQEYLISNFTNMESDYREALSAFLFSCYTGIRYSDICQLTYADMKRIKNKRWLIFTMQKTKQKVYVPLDQIFGGRALKIMRLFHRTRGKLFYLPSNAKCNRVIKRVYKNQQIGKKNISFHTGRHTAATLLLFYKIPLTTIQSILGHTHITTTEIYAEQNEATIYNSIKGVKFKEFI